MAKKTSPKAEKVLTYLVKNKHATPTEVAKATGVSYGYAYQLMKKVGTPKESSKEEAKRTAKKHLTSGSASKRSLGATRADILDTAKTYVTKDRASDHGDIENNFLTIARYWSIHLDHEVTATDVAVMMNLLKVARIKSNPSHADNWIDGAGYMACGGELAGETT